MGIATSPVTTIRRNPASPVRHVDVTLLCTTLALAAIGVVMVYSATQHKLAAAGADPQLYLIRQAIWVILGIVAMVAMTFVDYRLIRDFSPVVYLATVFVLLAVLSPLGSASKGAQAWFQVGAFQFQPSEWAKLALVVCIGAYAARHRGDLDAFRLHVVLGIMAVPMALIYLQPDLGTDLVFVAILLAVLLVGGARPRHIAALALLGAVGVAAVFQFGVLKHYQVDRLSAFLDPHNDQQRVSYNQNQSKVAIGGGGLTGKGLFKGTQTNLSFVPEQHTDFIFTAVGEELGFAGAATLLALFALLVWRTWRCALLSRDDFGTLVCVGVLAMIVFQVFENVGMTMGIMPVAGIPLPFLSYGGSATIASFAAVGLVQNVHMRRFS
jgi:rod shape determining protein RodA